MEPDRKFALNVQRLRLIGARESAARYLKLHEALTAALKVAESKPSARVARRDDDYENAQAAFVKAVQRDLAPTSQPGITPARG